MMNLNTDEIYSQVRYLEIQTKRILNTHFSGEYLSAFKGVGIEFEEVRPYVEGDDVRFIDWNVTAKSNQPYVKIFKEERELSVFLMLDMSGSMRFGSAQDTKEDLLTKISALLALVSLKNNDRIGLIIFTDKIEKIILPKKGRRHALRILDEILRFQAENKKTNMADPLEVVAKLKIKKSIIFLISDFKTDHYQRALDIVVSKHDLVPIVIEDPLETRLPTNLTLRLTDYETDQVILVAPNHPTFKPNWTQLMTAQSEALHTYFLARDLDYIKLRTDQPYLNTFIQYFKRRRRRRMG